MEIEGLVDQMNLRLSLLGTSQKKAAEEIHDLKVTNEHEHQFDSYVPLLSLTVTCLFKFDSYIPL